MSKKLVSKHRISIGIPTNISPMKRVKVKKNTSQSQLNTRKRASISKISQKRTTKISNVVSNSFNNPLFRKELQDNHLDGGPRTEDQIFQVFTACQQAFSKYIQMDKANGQFLTHIKNSYESYIDFLKENKEKAQHMCLQCNDNRTLTKEKKMNLFKRLIRMNLSVDHGKISEKNDTGELGPTETSTINFNQRDF